MKLTKIIQHSGGTITQTESIQVQTKGKGGRSSVRALHIHKADRAEQVNDRNALMFQRAENNKQYEVMKAERKQVQQSKRAEFRAKRKNLT